MSRATIQMMPTFHRIHCFSRVGYSTWLPDGARMQMAVCAIISSTTSRASGMPPIEMSIRPERRWTRSKIKSSTTRVRSKRSMLPRWSSDQRNGAGADIFLAVMISNMGALMAGAICPIAPIMADGIIYPGCSINCARITQRQENASLIFLPSTITRRAGNSATMSRPPCNSSGTAPHPFTRSREPRMSR